MKLPLLLSMLFLTQLAQAQFVTSPNQKLQAFKRCDEEVFTALHVGRLTYMEKRSGQEYSSNAFQNGQVDKLIQSLENQAREEISQMASWNHVSFAARRYKSCYDNESALKSNEPIEKVERCLVGSEAIYWITTYMEDEKSQSIVANNGLM